MPIVFYSQAYQDWVYEDYASNSEVNKQFLTKKKNIEIFIELYTKRSRRAKFGFYDDDDEWFLISLSFCLFIDQNIVKYICRNGNLQNFERLFFWKVFFQDALVLT